MVDTLEPDDIERMENAVNPSSLKSRRELLNKLEEKNSKGKNIFPKKLQDFLYDRFSRSMISERERNIAVSLLSRRGKRLEDADSITRGIWKGCATLYIRGKDGKIKTWGVDSVKPDYNREIERKRHEIKMHESKIARLSSDIQKLEEYKAGKGVQPKEQPEGQPKE